MCRSQPKYCLESGETGNFLIILHCLQDPISSKVLQPLFRPHSYPWALSSTSHCLLAVSTLGLLPGLYPCGDGLPAGRCLLRREMIVVQVQSLQWHRHAGVQNDSPGCGTCTQHLCHSTDVGQRGDSCYCQNANE